MQYLGNKTSFQPVKSEMNMEGDSNLKVVQYERTPIMSTYLLAFVVGEYDYIEAKDEDGVLVRVYTPVGKKEQGRFALQVSWKVIVGAMSLLPTPKIPISYFRLFCVCSLWVKLWLGTIEVQ
jgi:hypothetical protein